jgi:hypothetical protein
MKRPIEGSYDPDQPSNDTNHPSPLALFYTSNEYPPYLVIKLLRQWISNVQQAK